MKEIVVALVIAFFAVAGFGLAWLIFILLGEKIAHIVAGPLACLMVAFGLVLAIQIEKLMAGKGF
jgi:hypothetical protein